MKWLAVLLMLGALLSGCGGGGGGSSSGSESSDRQPPAVIMLSPVPAASEVSPSAPILVRFSEPIQSTGLTVTMTVAGSIRNNTYTVSGNQLSIVPNAGVGNTLAGAASIQVSGIRDLAGNAMTAPVNWGWTYAATNVPDTTAPSIVIRTPAPDAIDVVPDTVITITFSEVVQVGDANVSVQHNQTGVAVSRNVAGSQLQLQTSIGAAASGVITVTLTGISDLSGNVMATTSWSFSLATGQVEYGMEQRPLNDSCLAPTPIISGNPTPQWVKAFPQLANLALPTSLFQLPGDDGHWYALLQAGRVVRFNNDAAATTASTALDIQDRVEFGGWQGDEQGLLGVAVHPAFSANRQIFLYYSGNPAGGGLETRVARYTVNADGSMDRNSETIFMRLNRPNANHLGGQMAFGPDGFLYIGSGDGGGSGDPDQNGQDPNTLLGKVLRIDVNTPSGGKLYSVPASNPFVGQSNTQPEIFAYGLRNPWRFSFDRANGELWLGDVGQSAWEEINLITAGGNYGWSDMEGMGCFRSGCSTAGKILPIRAVDHNNGACSVIGGFVYRGQQYPSLVGKYFYSDYCESTVRSLTKSGAGYADASYGQLPLNIVSFAQDNHDEQFLIGHASGTGNQIYKLVVTGGQVTPGKMPAQLSATGCVEPGNPTVTAAGLIPFGVNSALWSDGVSKQRYIALPNQQRIGLDSNNDFVFPVGTVLKKDFSHNGKLIETRLLALSETGWSGFSYEWRDDLSEADLLPDFKDKTVDGLAWHYPSSGQCQSCHTSAAGFSLGAEALQLNGSFVYPQSGINANQLLTLEHIGVFDRALTNADTATRLVALSENSQSVTSRARSYLHSNCSGCHRPGGPTPVNIDLRFTTALSDTRTCDQLPSAGDLGISQARIIAPGDAGRSVLLARMQATNGNRMPPLGTHLVDQAAVALIGQWIGSLSSCNGG